MFIITIFPTCFKFKTFSPLSVIWKELLCGSLNLSLSEGVSAQWTPGRTIEYLNYSKSNPEVFLRKVGQGFTKFVIYNSKGKQYDLLSDVFKTI